MTTKRREIISNLGSNLLLADKTLDIDLQRPIRNRQKWQKDVQVAAERFAPLENVDNSANFRDYLSENPAMGGWGDLNPDLPLSQSGALTSWATATMVSEQCIVPKMCAQQDSNLRPTA